METNSSICSLRLILVHGAPGELSGLVRRGKVEIAGSCEAPGARLAHAAAALLWQQAGF